MIKKRRSRNDDAATGAILQADTDGTLPSEFEFLLWAEGRHVAERDDWR